MRFVFADVTPACSLEQARVRKKKKPAKTKIKQNPPLLEEGANW